MEKNKISAIVLTKNEQKKIGDCLDSLQWVYEIVLVDTGSKDKTLEIAQSKGAKIVKYSKGSYSDWRNKGLEMSSGEWMLYVDADERVTPQLRDEIQEVITNGNFPVFAIPRRNIILGKAMMYGGWWPDYVIRLMKKSSLRGWTGDLHEEPHYEGKLGYLNNPLVHIKHDNLSEMIEKSNKWSEREADLFIQNNHPSMSWWRFLRIMATELWYRLFVLKGFMDGTEGIIYAMYQMWYRFMVYVKLWEMQGHTIKLVNKAPDN